jgi:ubiquinone/menaquinone biosynthesis C-methylase UbiE
MGVDYEHAAHEYEHGRSVSDELRRSWGAAVAARLPEGSLRTVVDVGAGTGAFLPMWVELGAELLVAVEPAAAMRERITSHRVPGGVMVVSASGVRLPLADGSVDAAWLSAVLHHLPDLDEAAVELRRVVRTGGRVLVRGFLPDRSEVPWLEHLPGADRAELGFPTSDVITAAFERAGVEVVDVVEVDDPHRATGHHAAEWVRSMRAADSLLIGLDDREVDEGVASLERCGDEVLAPVRLSLLTAVVP